MLQFSGTSTESIVQRCRSFRLSPINVSCRTCPSLQGERQLGEHLLRHNAHSSGAGSDAVNGARQCAALQTASHSTATSPDPT